MSDNNKQSKLFNEFPPISVTEWEKKIIEDLKGADYEKKLVWKTIEGLKFKPYYREEDLKNLEHLKSLPGQAPYIRGNKINNNCWQIRQDVDADNIQEANKIAVDAIEKGATAIGFNIKTVETEKDMHTLLNGIDIEKVAIHFYTAKSYIQAFELYVKYVDSIKADKNKVKGSFNFDSINYFLLHGNFYTKADNEFLEAASLVAAVEKHLPNFKCININAQYFHNAGASNVQELGLCLASANEYVANLTAKGLSIDQIAPYMQFTLAIGSNYFLEIAKIRAIRILWSKIVEQYQPKKEISKSVFIHTVTSTWNKTVYDPNVNMLRTTTEAMAAAIGGCDSMTVLPYDACYKKPDEFSNRIARNTQLVLQHEANFDKIVDVSAGSYYIENLTDSIAQAAWKYFQQIEEMGGYLEAIKSRFVHEEIATTCQQRDMDIAMRKTVILGTNQYPNTNERMLGKMQPHTRLDDLAGLKAYRGAQAFEALRMSTEDMEKKLGKLPKVFLLTYGNLAMRKARATFSANFFGCAGYEIIDNNGFKTIDEGVEAAFNAKAEIVVICSSDEEYAQIGVEATQKIKAKNAKTQVVIAGNPTEIIDQLKSAGLNDFIHVRSNLLETLQKYNAILANA